MDHIPGMVDLAYTDEEKAEKAKSDAARWGSPSEDGADPVYNGPDYPYGMCICLSDRELTLGGLDAEDIDVGDMIHIHCFAKVTSVSADQTSSDEGKVSRRVELQVTHLSAEDEDEENEEEDARESQPSMLDKMYG